MSSESTIEDKEFLKLFLPGILSFVCYCGFYDQSPPNLSYDKLGCRAPNP